MKYARLAVAALVCGVSNLQAQLYWDTNGDLAGAGNPANGTWNAANTLWSTSAAGDIATVGYTAGSDVIFSAGTDAATAAVAMGSNVSAASLTFQEGATTFTGNYIITLSNGITVASTVGANVTQIGNASGSTKISVSDAQTWANNNGPDLANRLIVGGGTINARVTIAGDGIVQLGNTGTSNSFGGSGGFQIGTELAAGTGALSTSSTGFGSNDFYLVNGTLRGAGSGTNDSSTARVKGMSNVQLFLQGDFTLAYSSDGAGGTAKGLTLDADRVLTVANGTNSFPTGIARVDDGVAGSILTKAGNGVLSITTSNSTYSGGTVLQGGTLRIAGDGSLGAEPGAAETNITFSENATLQAGAASVIVGANRNILIASGKAANFSSTGNSSVNTLEIAGVISGDGAVTKSASVGTVVLSGLNTYTGVTTVAAASGSILSVNQLANGGSASSIGQSSSDAANLLLGNGSTFQYTGADVSSDRLFTVNGTGAGHSATLEASGTGALNLSNSGNIAYGSNNQTRTLNLAGTNTGNNTLAATVANNGSGAATINKNGAGKWILSGTNTYTGATTVGGGTLVVTGTINNTSAVTVSSGTFDYANNSTALNRTVNVSGGNFRYNSSQAYSGALNFTSGSVGGTGNLTGTAFTIGVGQVMAPGNSTGSQSVGATTWATGGTFQFELNDATGTAGSTTAGWDLLNPATLNITAGVGEFTLQIVSLDGLQSPGLADNFNELASYEWLFLDANSEITGFNANRFFFDTASFQNGFTGAFAVARGDTISGGDSSQLYLTYTAIPEPSTYALMGLGLSALYFLRRTRRA